MADRTQNIVINYKFNTAELQRAEQLTQRAQQATDNLRNTTQKAGANLGSAYRRVVPSIENLNARIGVLRERIAASSNPKQIAQLSAEYRKLKAQVDAATKSAFGLNKSLRAQASEIRNIASTTQTATFGFQQLYGAVRAVFTAAIVREVVDLSLNMAELAGNVDGVSRAFSRLPNSELLLHQLRQATHGTLNDLQLMQQALRAQNFGIPLENLGTFLEFAAIRAQQTGESVDYLVNSIVLGLGRDSVKILDNLQVDVGKMRDRMKEAGITLDEAFSEQVQEQMQKAGGFVENIGTEASRAKVEFHDLRVAIANAFSGQNEQNINFFAQTIDGITRFVKNLKVHWTEIIFVAGLFKSSIDAISGAVRDRIKEEAKLLAIQDSQRVVAEANTREGDARLDFILDEINNRVDLIRTYDEEIKRRRELLKEVRAAGFERANEVKGLTTSIKAWENNKLVIQETIKLLNNYLTSLVDVNKANENVLGLVARQRQIVEGLQQAIEEATDERALFNLNRQLIFAEARLNDLLALGTKTIDLKINVKLSSPRLQSEIIQPFVNAQGEIVRYESKVTNAIQNTTNSFLQYNDVIDRIEANLKELANVKLPTPPTFAPEQITFFDELATEFVDNWQAISASVTDINADFLTGIIEQEAQNFSRRIDQVRDFYDAQIDLAGNNERAKERLALERDRKIKQLERQEFERNKRAARATTIINGAAAVVKAFLTAPNYVVAVIQAALIAAETALQLNTINRARFAKGKINIQGPGTGTSDSIPAKISKGESVIRADATKKSMGLLELINAKKIDDSVLKDIVVMNTSNGGMSDKNIVSELQSLKSEIASLKNAFPDIFEQSGVAYRVEKKTDTFIRKVRAKSLSK